MKKIDYQAPEMEVVKLNMESNLLTISYTDDTPKISDNPGDGEDAI
jgi:hypothetical protein